jgi:hypothetical protein
VRTATKGEDRVKRRILTGSAALLIIGMTLLAVFGYNYWSYCCGRCTVGTFLTLGPFGLALLALNALAAAVLVALRIRRRMRHSRTRCRCGATLADGWGFCPDCGEAASFSPS